MSSARIIVADDEDRIRGIIRDFLEVDGFEVLEAADGEEALNLFYSEKDIDMLLLDVMMPKINGWEVCKEIRAVSLVPIVMLTALDQEKDELKGFKCGADEYISKPFSPKVMLARVHALLRRTESQDEKMQVGEISLDAAAHSVTVAGSPIELSFKEFELLHYLMQNAGIALTRETILNHVWNYDYYGDARTIDTHIKKLRSKLGDCGSYIHTIWGMGYKFEAN